MAGKVETVRLELIEFTADRLQYKPYSAKLGALTDLPIMVEIPVDSEFIIQKTSDRVVISVDGLASMMGTVAKSIEDMHNEYIKSLRR